MIEEWTTNRSYVEALKQIIAKECVFVRVYEAVLARKKKKGPWLRTFYAVGKCDGFEVHVPFNPTIP